MSGFTDWLNTNSGLVSLGLGLFGNYQSSQAAKDAAGDISSAAQIAADAAQFRPYSVTTGMGTSFFDAENQRAAYELDPALQAFRDQYLTGAATTLPFDNLDPNARAQQYYDEIQTMMEPARLQENQQLQQDLFGSGRLGMRLAGQAAGAGQGGMYQPDVLGFQKSRDLANQALAQQARVQSQTELDQAIARGTGLFQTGMGIEQLGLTPLELGAQFGGYGAQAAGTSANALLQGGQMAAQANLASGLNSANLFGNLGLGLMRYNQPAGTN